jgi:hypothetical protein
MYLSCDSSSYGAHFISIECSKAHLLSLLHSRICQYGNLSLNTIKKPLPKI